MALKVIGQRMKDFAPCPKCRYMMHVSRMMRDRHCGMCGARFMVSKNLQLVKIR